MKQFLHVEDYIEFMAGYEPNFLVTKTSHLPFITGVPKPISLARYDVNVVDNMADNTIWGTALTDRQAPLAARIVLKYRRQFAKLGIDVTPVENPVYRITPRVVNRIRSVQLADNRIHIRFPYDQSLIDDIKNAGLAGQGAVRFDHVNRVWILSLTEYLVNFSVTWGQVHGFEIDPSLQEIMREIVACESQDHDIRLERTDEGLRIKNAAASLLDYLEQQGGLVETNLLHLISLSGLLGYSVSPDLMAVVPSQLQELAAGHSLHLQASQSNLDRVFDYAELMEQWPVCVYDPMLTDYNLQRFSSDQVILVDHNGKISPSIFDLDCVKVVYAKKIPRIWNSTVPIMVSTAEMIHGARKSQWTQQAQKIIYLTTAQLKATKDAKL